MYLSSGVSVSMSQHIFGRVNMIENPVCTDPYSEGF